jgi:hypothetical protein
MTIASERRGRVFDHTKLSRDGEKRVPCLPRRVVSFEDDLASDSDWRLESRR